MVILSFSKPWKMLTDSAFPSTFRSVHCQKMTDVKGLINSCNCLNSFAWNLGLREEWFPLFLAKTVMWFSKLYNYQIPYGTTVRVITCKRWHLQNNSKRILAWYIPNKNWTKLRSLISKEVIFSPACNIQFHQAADFQAKIRQKVYNCKKYTTHYCQKWVHRVNHTPLEQWQ